MGGCLGPEPGVSYTNPINPNPPAGVNWNSQPSTPSYKSTPSPNLHPKPNLNPTLPKSLVLPSSNPYLVNQIFRVPQ